VEPASEPEASAALLETPVVHRTHTEVLMQVLERQPSPVATVDSDPAPPSRVWPQRTFTAVLVIAPAAALAVIFSRVLSDGLAWQDILIAAAFYVVVGHGVSVGFHRLFTHRSFEARRPLKIALALVGSLSLQGSLIGWVAEHRRHHMFTERPGDPHSPVRPSTQPFGRLRGLWHAHVGWLFETGNASPQRFAPDLLADRDIVIIDRLFIPFAVLTLLLPFGLGYAITGRLSGAIALFLWAGVLRVGLLHHVTWATNSLCHSFGRRPFATRDASRNLAPLALLSMGEAWHNAHHAFPSLARHGVDAHQLDTSAILIRIFERMGWATQVRWPDPVRLAARRVALLPTPQVAR
jgi:stearoyl-CoA desaturase (delta-9 desaturase)